ncbi:MAG: hypothetical protein HN348_31680, partial [Proteobacteria bacterium]|nr:hypothetical protein [Pseudomonadota bacterium]
LLSLAGAISSYGRSIDERLLQIFLDDPVLHMKKKALRILLLRDLKPWAQRARAAALRHPSYSIRLQATATLPASEARPVIKELLNEHPSSNAAIVEALKQLRQVGTAVDAAAALAWLNNGNVEIQLASVRCLARLGSLQLVDKLLHLKGNTRSTTLRDQIDGAIGAIQTRQSKGMEGQLSVARLPKEEGQLSVADSGVGGRLSVAQRDDLEH